MGIVITQDAGTFADEDLGVEQTVCALVKTGVASASDGSCSSSRRSSRPPSRRWNMAVFLGGRLAPAAVRHRAEASCKCLSTLTERIENETRIRGGLDLDGMSFLWMQE